MKTLWPAMTLFLIAVLTNGMVSAQVAPVRHHPDPNLSSLAGSAPGRGLPGGKDPSIKIGASSRLSEAGDAAAKQGDWQTAAGQYQAALDIWPDNTLALYGSAKCAEAEGDLDAAIGFYRKSVYSHNPAVYGTTPGDGWGTNNVEKMMDFVLVLSQAHQDVEAQKVYKRAAYVLNYQDSKFDGGKPFLRVLLPEFGSGPNQIAETPARLQAMAHVALAIKSAGFDGAVALPESRKAIRLYPDSPVANYYLGEQLLGRYSHEAKIAYMKAAQLGDPQVKAEAHKRGDSLP